MSKTATKFYSVKSSARRAAKAQFGDDFESKVDFIEKNGEWGFVEKKAAPAPKKESPKKSTQKEEKVETPKDEKGQGDLPGVERPENMTKCPQCGSEEIFTGRVKMVKDRKTGEMVSTGIVEDEGLCGGCHHCDWEWNLIDVQRAKSVVENPTRLAWDIADAMILEPRKEVVKAMIAAGIANGTSRTQYQYWFNVNKARKHEAIAAHNAELAKRAESKKSK